MSEAKIVYDLSVDMPNLPKGEQIQIAGLGTFENGSSYEITDEEAEAYRVANGTTEPVEDPETHAILSLAWQKGPTLLEASKTMYGVEVTTHSKSGGGNQSPQTPTPPKAGEGDQNNGGDK